MFCPIIGEVVSCYRCVAFQVGPVVSFGTWWYRNVLLVDEQFRLRFVKCRCLR